MTEEATTPALFHHCETVYDELLSQAKRVELDNGASTGMVYEGFLTALIKDDLHLSTPYYTSVTNALKKMGCIQQLRRGGSTTPSQWLLLKEPTLDLWNDNKLGQNTGRIKYVTLDQHRALQTQIGDLNRRLSEVERRLGL